MNFSKNLLKLLILLGAFSLVGCNNTESEPAETTEATDTSETTETTEASEEETETESEEETEAETEEETEAETSEDTGSGETGDGSSPATAAGLGDWVETTAIGKNMEVGPIRYRITEFYTDEEEIRSFLDDYNATEPVFTIELDELPTGTALRAFDYEVIYEDDFPGQGEGGEIIYSPELRFSVETEDGGGVTDSTGTSYIGLSVEDISIVESEEDLRTGETFTGRAVYVVPEDRAEDYFITAGYTTEDPDNEGEYITVTTWNTLE